MYSIPPLHDSRYIFDNVNDAIFIHDLEGHFLDVNRIACERLGYTREELLQMHVQQIDAPEFAKRFAVSMQGFLQKGSMVAESAHVRKDGTRIPVEIGARFIEYEGKPAVLSVARDLSERKRAEHEIQQLQDQIQNMAIRVERDRLGRELHDGLGQVLGFIGMKAAALAGMIQRQQITQAEQAANELGQIAQSAYAEVREAILGLRATISASVGLESTLREYLHRFQREWNISTELIIAPDTPTRFAPSTEIQLLRILQEALRNVRQHAQATHTTVRFEKHADVICVTVQDDGRGFDLDQPRPEHYGLQTMRERAESFGGKLEIDSAPGRGTRIVVNVPVQTKE